MPIIQISLPARLPPLALHTDDIGAQVANSPPLECQPFDTRPYWPLYHIIGNVSVPRPPPTCSHPRRPTPPCPAHYWEASGGCFQTCLKASTRRDQSFQRCLCDAATPCVAGLTCINGTCCSQAATDLGPQIVGGGPTDGNALFGYKKHYHLMHQDHSHGTTWGHLISSDVCVSVSVVVSVPLYDYMMLHVAVTSSTYTKVPM